MPSRDVVSRELAVMFGVLSHPERIRIVEELRAGEKDVNTLCEGIGVRQPRVSQHLSTLKAHRMVQERREGRHVFYHLTQSEMAAWILEGLDFIEARLESAERRLTAVDEARQLWSGTEKAEAVTK